MRPKGVHLSMEVLEGAGHMNLSGSLQRWQRPKNPPGDGSVKESEEESVQDLTTPEAADGGHRLDVWWSRRRP